MARSLKKGPFADESLLKKVDAMNESNNKQVSRHGHADPRSSLHSLDIRSRFTTEESMFPYISRKTWLDINLASS